MLRFTIRDVLWLTLVVALGVALAIEHRKATLAEMAWHYWESQRNPDLELNKTTAIVCSSAPLRDMADHISNMHMVPVVLDPEVNGDIPIACRVSNESLRAGLDKMLAPHDLRYRIKEGAIVIERKQSTTRQNGDEL